MEQFILILHIVGCFALIGLILMQHGKGAEAGAAFGAGGSSQTVFGSRGAGSFLIKVTGILAALFFITSISLNYLNNHRHQKTLVDDVLAVKISKIPFDKSVESDKKST